jgi:hypothetical protein
LIDKVDVIITDSPLLLSIIYKPDYIPNSFNRLVIDTFNSYNNLNYFIERSHEFNPNGRVEKTLEEAIIKDNQIKKLLVNNNIEYESVLSEEEYIQDIVVDIVDKIKWKKGVI